MWINTPQNNSITHPCHSSHHLGTKESTTRTEILQAINVRWQKHLHSLDLSLYLSERPKNSLFICPSVISNFMTFFVDSFNNVFVAEHLIANNEECGFCIVF